MCSPVAAAIAIPAGLQIVSMIMGAEAQDQKNAQNERAARDAQRQDNIAIGRQMSQQQRVASMTIMQADRQAREADALARVSSGEAGVSGSSVDALLGSIERDRLEADTATQRNLSDSVQQLELEKRGAKARAETRINAVPKSNPWVTGLGIAGTVANAGGQYVSSLPKIG